MDIFYSVDTVDTVYAVYTVDMEYTVDMVYTVVMVYTVDMVYSWQFTLLTGDGWMGQIGHTPCCDCEKYSSYST